MNRKLRYAGLVAGLAIVAAACAPGASTSPSGAAVTPAASAPASSESAAPAGLAGKLTVWETYGSSGGNAEFKAFTQNLKAITDANPDLKVSFVEVPFANLFQKYQAEAKVGRGPDMFIAPNDSLGDLVRLKVISDLTGKIDDTVANTNQVSVDGMTVDGKIYGVPESIKAVELYYDTAKFPTPPKTTDDLLAAAKAGTKIGVVAPDGYFGWGFYQAFGGKIFDENGKCAATANSGVADAMAYVKALKDAGALVDPTYNTVNDAFKSGKIDAILTGNWTLGDYKTARPTVAVAPMPAGPSGSPAGPMTGIDGWYINSASKNQDLAIAVAQQMVNQASQQVEVDVAGHVPANKNVTIADPLVKSFSDAFATGVPRPQIAEMGNYWSNFGNAWAEVLTKGADPTAAVAKACAAMDTANKK